MNGDAVKTHLKRFISNKNTVTFLLVLVLIVIVYFAYNYLVNKAISPVTIPYATTLIKEKTEITSAMIGTIQISGTFVTSSGEGLLQSRGQILEKYVAEGYQIPANSFFYSEAVVEEDEVNKTTFDDIPDGYTVFQLPVDFHSTYGCSIMPGNYIDLYFKATDDTTDKNIIFGLFIKSIEVREVVDADGYDVFTTTEEDDEPQPKYMYFAVPEYYFELLRKAMLITTNDIEIIPVPRNAGYSENPEETTIASESIENFILSKTVYITD